CARGAPAPRADGRLRHADDWRGAWQRSAGDPRQVTPEEGRGARRRRCPNGAGQSSGHRRLRRLEPPHLQYEQRQRAHSIGARAHGGPGIQASLIPPWSTTQDLRARDRVRPDRRAADQTMTAPLEDRFMQLIHRLYRTRARYARVLLTAFAAALPVLHAARSGAQQALKGVWEPVNYKGDIHFTDVFFVTPEEGWVAG